MSKQVIELRRSIKETMTAVGGTNGLSRNELLSEIRNRCAKQIEAARSDLEAIALGKLLNEIGGSKCSMPNGQGLDLFGNYSGIPMSIAIQKVRQDGGEFGKENLLTNAPFLSLPIGLRRVLPPGSHDPPVMQG